MHTKAAVKLCFLLMDGFVTLAVCYMVQWNTQLYIIICIYKLCMVNRRTLFIKIRTLLVTLFYLIIMPVYISEDHSTYKYISFGQIVQGTNVDKHGFV